MTKRAQSARDLALTLTKEELIALLDKKWWWMRIEQADIITAKIDVLIEKAEKVFAEYLAFKLPETNGTTDSTLEFYKMLAEKEKIYKKHERINKKIECYFKQIETLRK